MSLLDRVQRRAEEAGSSPGRPAPDDAGGGPAAPGGWQVRPAPASPFERRERPPEPASGFEGAEQDGDDAGSAQTPPMAPRPRPTGSTPNDPGRQSPLLNRTGLGRRVLPKAAGHGTYAALRSKVHTRLVEELAGNTDSAPPEVVRQRIAELVNEVTAEQQMTLGREEKQRVAEIVINDVLGLGPLEELLENPDVTEIMVNGFSQIYIEQHGKITLSPVTFESNEQLMQVIDRIVSSIGRRVDESSPMVDARLKDGSRVNVIIPPLALRGPTVTIRKFAKEGLEVEDLVRFGWITEDMIRFLEACVRGRLNVVVSGGTGSGKTTTLNILSSFIPGDERIVTIEDAAELQLRQEHVVTLETRPANVEGRGRITIRDLVINALRMRPDRIVIGECRGGEALDMLQAMNTGHDGSLTTLHANNARDAINRPEQMVSMAGAELPSPAIREQISSAINVIVQQSRLRDGSRKIIAVSEVLGLHGDQVKVQDIFVFKQTGVSEDGKVQGYFTATGIIPKYFDHLQSSGEGVGKDIFTPSPDPAGQGGN